MKKINIAFFVCTVALIFSSCNDNQPTGYETQKVSVNVTGELTTLENIEVKLIDSRGTYFIQSTDKQGIAVFEVPAGIYQATVSHVSDPQDGWPDGLDIHSVCIVVYPDEDTCETGVVLDIQVVINGISCLCGNIVAVYNKA